MIMHWVCRLPLATHNPHNSMCLLTQCSLQRQDLIGFEIGLWAVCVRL
jgi:hypothetical protein